jgi:acylphosphatase
VAALPGVWPAHLGPPGVAVVTRQRVLVSGHVQGVLFRDTCRTEAQRAGVAGWVRNLYDGRVEAVFEGQPEAVRELVAWMHRGPRHAVVEHVEVIDEQPEGLSGFEIRWL